MYRVQILENKDYLLYFTRDSIQFVDEYNVFELNNVIVAYYLLE